MPLSDNSLDTKRFGIRSKALFGISITVFGLSGNLNYYLNLQFGESLIYRDNKNGDTSLEYDKLLSLTI